MNKFFMIFLILGSVINLADAETSASHCAGYETTLFSCVLNDQRVVSLCTSKKSPDDNGYLQYRFGKIGKVELFIPKKKTGIPDIALVYRKDKYARYDKVAIVNEPFTYNIESYRQFKKENKDGYPAPKSNDTLNIEDSRKSTFEGNIVNNPCSALVDPVNAKDIAKLTGIKVD